MANSTSNGAQKTLTVINVATKDFVGKPTNYQEIIKKQTNFEDLIKTLVRTGGKGKLQSDGTLKYAAFGKAEFTRKIESVVDTATGKQVASDLYGAEGTGYFAYVEPTTTLVAETKVTLEDAGKFMKEIIAKNDIKADGLPTLVSDRIQSYKEAQHDAIIKTLKDGFTAAVGTLGDLAHEFSFTIPATTGAGKRVQARDYANSAQGGQEAYSDIDKSLRYLSRIGSMDGSGVEPTYPFARGIKLSNIVLIISPEVNRSLTQAFDGHNTSKGMAGLVVNGSNVSSIFGVKVIILDMPKKGGKNFNWLMLPVGANGAIAFPMYFQDQYLVRPHTEGVSLLAVILEGISGQVQFKALQPELMISSYKVT